MGTGGKAHHFQQTMSEGIVSRNGFFPSREEARVWHENVNTMPTAD